MRPREGDHVVGGVILWVAMWKTSVALWHDQPLWVMGRSDPRWSLEHNDPLRSPFYYYYYDLFSLGRRKECVR